MQALVKLKQNLRLRTRYHHWRRAPHPRHFPLREMVLLSLARRLWKERNPTEPLISVTIATFNRGKLLGERTLPSVLAQTYQNFEIIVVGDGCTDDTAERINALGEPRIRFLNLPRGIYPTDLLKRWQVAGTFAINKGIDLAEGDWIAYLDDDDVYLPNHLESLLECARSSQLEFVYGIGEHEITPGRWIRVGCWPPVTGSIAHSAILYSRKLQFFKYDPQAWRRNLPGDGEFYERMSHAGVRMRFVEKTVSRAPLRPGETMVKWIELKPEEAKERFLKSVFPRTGESNH